MAYAVGSGPTGRVNVPGAGPPPGHANAMRGGLWSARFAEVARGVGPSGRAVLRLAVERALSDALLDCPRGRSAYASAKRNYCRDWAVRQVLGCLKGADLDAPLLGDAAVELCRAFAPIWTAVEPSPFWMLRRGPVGPEFEREPAFRLPEDARSLEVRRLAEAEPSPHLSHQWERNQTGEADHPHPNPPPSRGRGKKLHPYADRWHRETDVEGRARERAVVGAYQQFNRMGHGLRSRLFGPVARSLPPRARPLLTMAIQRAVGDALAGAPPTEDVTPYAAAARGYARMQAARRVFACVAAMDLDVPGLLDDAGVRLCYALAPIWVGALG